MMKSNPPRVARSRTSRGDARSRASASSSHPTNRASPRSSRAPSGMTRVADDDDDCIIIGRYVDTTHHGDDVDASDRDARSKGADDVETTSLDANRGR